MGFAVAALGSSESVSWECVKGRALIRNRPTLVVANYLIDSLPTDLYFAPGARAHPPQTEAEDELLEVRVRDGDGGGFVLAPARTTDDSKKEEVLRRCRRRAAGQGGLFMCPWGFMRGLQQVREAVGDSPVSLFVGDAP